MVFSATIRESLEPLLRKFLSNTITLEVEKKDVSSLKIEHFLIPVKYRDKDSMLLELTQIINPYLAIVFANRKDEAQRIYEFLKYFHRLLNQLIYQVLQQQFVED